VSEGTPAQSKLGSPWRLAGIALAMFGFGFALVPMYNALCEITNQNGKDNAMLVPASDLVEQPDVSRQVTVQFTTSVNGGRDWGFKPDVQTLKVHPGQLYTVNFTARNPDDVELVGQAVPSVAPWNAARYLKKTECFCFQNQPFKGGEQKHMPVRFMIERDLPPDVDTVTLSYTFFDVTAQAAARRTEPQS
jgi:cytochrome c oxidase assembly protein subunit 11